MKKELAPREAVALAAISDHGGVLVRREGGRWVPPGGRAFAWFVNTRTINRLVTKGRLVVTEWQELPAERRPVRAALPIDGAQS